MNKYNNKTEKELLKSLTEASRNDNVGIVKDILLNDKYIIKMNKKSVISHLLLNSIENRSINIINFLFSEKQVLCNLDVNSINSNGDTALMIAVRVFDSKIFNILLENGANPKIGNEQNNTNLIDSLFTYINSDDFNGHSLMVSYKEDTFKMAEKIIVDFNHNISEKNYQLLLNNPNEVTNYILKMIDSRTLYQNMNKQLESGSKSTYRKI